jgi:hypothetical protein
MAPAPFPAKRNGNETSLTISGFPFFCDLLDCGPMLSSRPLQLIGNFITENCAAANRPRAKALWEQSVEFHEASKNPRHRTRPLLQYYFLLNLSKAWLLTKGVPISSQPKHGISDPGDNYRARFRLDGQIVRVLPKSKNRDQLFVEILNALGGALPANVMTDIKVLDLFELLPYIHRIYSHTRRQPEILVPVQQASAVADSRDYSYRIELKNSSQSYQALCGHLLKREDVTSRMRRVSGEKGKFILETIGAKKARPTVQAALHALAKDLRGLPITAMVSTRGWRTYLANWKTKHQYVPMPAAAYALVFFFGSMVRYRPECYDKVLDGKYGWLVDELLNLTSDQYAYWLASDMIGTGVNIPYAPSLSA